MSPPETLHRSLMRIIILASVALAFAAPLRGQLTQAPDSAQFQRAKEAGTYLVHWIQRSNASEQTINFRNTAAIPIRVERWEVYECINLAGRSCGIHQDGPVLQPGETKRIAIVRQRDERSPWSYQYRFTVSWVEPAPAP